ncbi:hypothetical protein Tco_1312980 [Tanacetum coccineum]
MFDKAFKRVNTFEDFRTELVEGKEKRVGTELEHDITKKQKVDDDKEIAELKYVVPAGRVIVVPTSRYVVPASRVVVIVVPTGRYVVPAGKVIIKVSPGRLNLVPTGRVFSPGSDNESDGASVHSEATIPQQTKTLQPRSFPLSQTAIAKVIQNGNSLKRTGRDCDGRSIPDDHVADFHYMDDARDIWNAVKARFGGNAESKKMRKSMLKQEFSEFRISKAEGLHKGYDRMQKILSQLNQLKAKPANTAGDVGEFALIGVTSECIQSESEVMIESICWDSYLMNPFIVQDLPSFSCNSYDKNENTSRTSCNKNGYFNKKAGHFRKIASSVSKNNANHQNQFVQQAVLLRTGKVNIPPARPQPVPTGKPRKSYADAKVKGLLILWLNIGDASIHSYYDEGRVDGYSIHQGDVMIPQSLASPRVMLATCHDSSRLDVAVKFMFQSSRYVVPAGRVLVPTGRYVVLAGRVVVPTGRYVVPAGKVIIIVSPVRLSLVPMVAVFSHGCEADRLFAEKLQEEEREQFTIEERAKFLHDTIGAQRKFLAQQRSEAIRNRPPTKNQLRNQMMTYLKHVGNFKHSDLKTKKFEEIQALYENIKRSNGDFISIGSAKDERLIKKMNEKGIDSSKNESVKEEDKEEEGTKKRKGGHIKMIARKKKRSQLDVDSDDEHKKCLKIVTFESILDSEIMEKKSVIARLNKVSSPDGDYLVIYRANGNFRAFNYLMEVLHIFDRQDLFHLYDLMREQYSEVTLDGFELILWGDLKIMMESSTEGNEQGDFWSGQQDWNIITWRLYESCGVCILEFEDGIVIHMLVERRYPLSKDLLQRMLDLGLEVERESSVALDLIRFIKQQIDEE